MNSVSIIGLLLDKIDDYFRYFEYDLPYIDERNEVVPRIPIKFWSNQPNSRLIALPDYTKVAIHGHLDNNKEFGTILLVEKLEVLH